MRRIYTASTLHLHCIYTASTLCVLQADLSKLDEIIASCPGVGTICLDVANGYSEAFVATVKAVCTLYVHCIHTACALHVHCMCTAYTLHALCVHCVCTALTLYLHCMHTAPTLHANTACTLHIRCVAATRRTRSSRATWCAHHMHMPSKYRTFWLLFNLQKILDAVCTFSRGRGHISTCCALTTNTCKLYTA